ncbi:MAG TPA: 1-deoxy-D-xylulose-5-phosphate synthase [Longimicrobiales bacterium]|nr:1-deoxy-D-xylulose-5-phosphate synthase [Longimicrobiales bacterium]
MALLETISGPADIRRLERQRLRELADEVRERLIDVVSQTGGHFAPGLGVVELTVALHYVFDTPRDRLVWDVGHQGYPHKILTGRNERLSTIRQKDGISGFLRREESEYDAFGAGHAATSISAALGMATARDQLGEDYNVIAVIGDGALTCGLAYEGLNNAGHTERDLIVVLNDNEMSIAPNVGAMSKYLTRIVTNPLYNRVREELKNLLRHTPSSMETLAAKLEDSLKTIFVPGMFFEDLGFRYVGPVDGHDTDRLVDTLSNVARMKGPRVVHVLTQKGKGYALAEQNPVVWHGAKPFDKISGKFNGKKGGPPAYTKVFGNGLMELGETEPRLNVITAAMPDGTGTGAFGTSFPDRFFDVGIAEAHGVTFAAGLASEGMRPVAAIYSTFLQRAYDSIIHDVCVQKLPVVFAMDRAGLVGNDGPTHMGLYDIAYLMAAPNMTVTAPKDGTELLALLRLGVAYEGGPFSLRYPRDNVPEDAVPPLAEIPPIEYGTWEVLRKGGGVAILAVGTMVLPALAAARKLEAEGIHASVVNCRFLKPMDEQTLAWVVDAHRGILSVEEGTTVNGFGAALAARMEARLADGEPAPFVSVMGVPDRIIEHATRGQQLEEVGLTPDAIADRARGLAEVARVRTVVETA